MENKEYEAPMLEIYRFVASTPVMSGEQCPTYTDPDIGCIVYSGGQGSNP